MQSIFDLDFQRSYAAGLYSNCPASDMKNLVHMLEKQELHKIRNGGRVTPYLVAFAPLEIQKIAYSASTSKMRRLGQKTLPGSTAITMIEKNIFKEK